METGSRMRNRSRSLAWRAVAICWAAGWTAGLPIAKADETGMRVATARASEIDPRAAEHPEIGFVFASDGKPQDLQHAMVDLDAPLRGQLVVWLMASNDQLFERLASYGYHVVQPHYARAWFGIVKPTDRLARGLVRLEAATGRDVSPQVEIPLLTAWPNGPTSLCDGSHKSSRMPAGSSFSQATTRVSTGRR